MSTARATARVGGGNEPIRTASTSEAARGVGFFRTIPLNKANAGITGAWIGGRPVRNTGRPRHGKRARPRHVSFILDRHALRVDERDARRAQHVGDGRVVAGELISMCETDRIIIDDEGPAQP